MWSIIHHQGPPYLRSSCLGLIARAAMFAFGFGCLSGTSIVFSPSAAIAGCGDYLHPIPTHSPPIRTILSFAISLSDVVNPNSPITPRPCDGPQCRKKLPASVPPTTPLPTTAREQLVIAAGMVMGYTILVAPSYGDVPLVLREGVRASIERPPRRSA